MQGRLPLSRNVNFQCRARSNRIAATDLLVRRGYECQIQPPLYGEVAKQSADVNFYRMGRQVELPGDFLVGAFVHQQREHRPLARGQSFRSALRWRCVVSTLLTCRIRCRDRRNVDRSPEQRCNCTLAFRLARRTENVAGHSHRQVAENGIGSAVTRNNPEDQPGMLGAKAPEIVWPVSICRIDVENRREEFARLQARRCIGKTPGFNDGCAGSYAPYYARNAFPQDAVPGD
jgi:hypothetical protein